MDTHVRCTCYRKLFCRLPRAATILRPLAGGIWVLIIQETSLVFLVLEVEIRFKHLSQGSFSGKTRFIGPGLRLAIEPWDGSQLMCRWTSDGPGLWLTIDPSDGRQLMCRWISDVSGASGGIGGRLHFVPGEGWRNLRSATERWL